MHLPELNVYITQIITHCFDKMIALKVKNNQGNQGYNGYQKNVIQGQRPDMETDIHNKEHKVTKIIRTFYKLTKT